MKFDYLFKGDDLSEKLKEAVYINSENQLRRSWNQSELEIAVVAFSKSLDLLPEQSIKLNSNLEELFSKEEERGSLISRVYQLKNIANRYLMIKDLFEAEKDLRFGILGLVAYLGLTCFDSLGQKAKFTIFSDWLQSKKNKEVDKCQETIENQNEFDFRKSIKDLYENYYNPKYGVRNSFFNFFDDIKNEKSYERLMSAIEIRDKLYLKRLEEHDHVDLIKKVWLFSFRNDFTHNTRNLRWPLESTSFCPSFLINNNSIPIRIIPNDFVDNILECVQAGIKLEFEKSSLF